MKNYSQAARRKYYQRSKICWVTFFLRLSELLYLPLPSLPTDSQKYDSILIGANDGGRAGEESDDVMLISGGKWEDEEERKFFEDVQDLKDFVPASVLGIEGDEGKKKNDKEREDAETERAAEEAKKLQEELDVLNARGENDEDNGTINNGDVVEKTEKDISQDDEDE